MFLWNRIKNSKTRIKIDVTITAGVRKVVEIVFCLKRKAIEECNEFILIVNFICYPSASLLNLFSSLFLKWKLF